MLISLIVFLYYIVIKNIIRMTKKSEQKFTGKINGVTYANWDEFQKALESMTKEEIRSIEYQDYQVEVNDDEAVVKKLPTPEYDLNTLFAELFGAFFGALAGHNRLKPVEQPTNANDNQKAYAKVQEEPITQAKEPITEVKKVEVDELVSKYLFNETTYEFTGGEEDEFELDKFDRFLQKKLDDFKQVDFSTRSGDELSDFLLDLRVPFMARVKEVSASINEEDDDLKDLDMQMANLENCINANATCGFDTTVVNEKYESVQHEFDVMQNVQNYHRLLKQYLTGVINHIDQQF
jgi:hypothetical protein